MMKIECDCGKFKADLRDFTGNNPGRLACYCDDCQNYLKRLGREEILDPYGGTEIIPVYPNNFEIKEGVEYLKCNILHEKGLKRWSVTCCNTPVANTMSKFPWVGVPSKLYINFDPESLKKMGKIRSRIKGKYKTSEPPFRVSENLKLRDAFVVLPFILKGFIFRKYNHSPFFKSDNITPLKEPVFLK